MFFLRESSLLKIFGIKTKTETVNENGRVIAGYNDGGSVYAILTDATTYEKEQYKSLMHPITHTITHRGSPVVKEGDLLTLDGRIFYVQGVEEPGGVGLWTIYNAEERKDYNVG